jgi:hypothetical protein
MREMRNNTKFWLETWREDEGHIKMDLKDTGFGLGLGSSGQDLVVCFMQGENFFNTTVTLSFSRRILFHTVS